MREVKGFPGYFVARSGDVWSKRTSRWLTPHLSCANGYMRYGLLDTVGRQRMVMLHRLVADAFLPNPKNLPQINHKNGNKLDNRITNLEWVNNSQNQRHAFRMGLQVSCKGEAASRAKLTDADVRFIRKVCADRSISQRTLAEMLGVHRSTILNVHLGRAWKHIE